MTRQDAFNKILSLIEIDHLPVGEEIPYQLFLLPRPLSIFGSENVLEFNRLISSLYEEDNDIYKSYSRKSFLEKLIALVSDKALGNNKFSNDEVYSFFKSLKASSANKYQVYRDIFGIKLTDDSKPFSIGNFKIYHFPSQKNLFQSIKDENLKLFLPKEPIYLIEYIVETREAKRAIEIADEYFNKFVIFLRYMIGTKTDTYEVGIIDYHGSRLTNAYAVCGEQFTKSSQRSGPFQPVMIDDPYFVSTAAGNDKLWSLLDRQDLSGLEKRIATAVEWVGRSLLEKTIQAAFIEASVAIESIFTYQEKSIITPSILNQISENVALLMGNTVDQRIEMEKELKQLYSIRSGIVHAGNKEIDLKDYQIFIQYIRGIIQKLLTDESLLSCKSIEDLYSLVKRIKYS